MIPGAVVPLCENAKRQQGTREHAKRAFQKPGHEIGKRRCPQPRVENNLLGNKKPSSGSNVAGGRCLCSANFCTLQEDPQVISDLLLGHRFVDRNCAKQARFKAVAIEPNLLDETTGC